MLTEAQKKAQKKYFNSPKGKKSIRKAAKKYRDSKKGKNSIKAAQRKNRQSEKRKEYLKNYRKTKKYKTYLKSKKHKEIEKKASKKWREKNKEKVNERLKKYYSKSEKRKEYLREYFKSEKHKTYRNNLIKRKRKENPAFRLSSLLRGRLRQVLKKQKATKFNSALEIVGCSLNELIKHFEKQFKNGMNWSNMNQWHIDHIRPISSFNLNDPTQQKKCFHFSNLQPLWAKDNLKKGSKLNAQFKNE